MNFEPSFFIVSDQRNLPSLPGTFA